MPQHESTSTLPAPEYERGKNTRDFVEPVVLDEIAVLEDRYCKAWDDDDEVEMQNLHWEIWKRHQMLQSHKKS